MRLGSGLASKLRRMPDVPSAAARPPRRRRPPGARRFVVGALASAVAVFGVLALRLHAGEDPALGHAKASSRTASSPADTSASGAASSSIDPYDTGSSGSDDGTENGDEAMATGRRRRKKTP